MAAYTACPGDPRCDTLLPINTMLLLLLLLLLMLLLLLLLLLLMLLLLLLMLLLLLLLLLLLPLLLLLANSRLPINALVTIRGAATLTCRRVIMLPVGLAARAN